MLGVGATVQEGVADAALLLLALLEGSSCGGSRSQNCQSSIAGSSQLYFSRK